MFGHKTARRHARRLVLFARNVELAMRLERAQMEVGQLHARYSGCGLTHDEIPGIKSARGVVRTIKRAIALVEVELANA
jgi:hypothetical protein